MSHIWRIKNIFNFPFFIQTAWNASRSCDHQNKQQILNKTLKTTSRWARHWDYTHARPNHCDAGSPVCIFVFWPLILSLLCTACLKQGCVGLILYATEDKVSFLETHLASFCSNFDNPSMWLHSTENFTPSTKHLESQICKQLPRQQRGD